ncbi:MAG: S8 family serine peptidase, partial [Bacteroidota bacterium]
LRKRTFTYLSGTNEQKGDDGTRTGLVIEQMEDYGKSFGQVSMLGADEMHLSGHRGQGMVVAIFDAGFNNVDEIPAFKHLFKEQRILGTYDFVKHEESVFEDDDHGRMVLSCIAAYDRGQMIGTAPEASFYLFRTEDAYSEYRVEEYNWLVAAEKADSLGVDVINSSLGYNNFDDTSMSYRYEDMDGKTAIISQAAEFASEVGMIVVSSAGNEGGNKWKYITAPADAPSVLSVGAVTSKQKIAYFSSRGNTSDGRIKPDLVAQGQSTRVVKRDGSVGAASGTSFSAPVMCGLVTSFWGANPQLTSRQVVSYLKRAGSQSVRPDATYGYGLPSYITAQNLVNRELGPYGLLTGKNANAFQVFPNPVEAGNIPTIAWGANYQPKALEIQVFDNAARKLVTIKVNKAGKETTLPMLNQLPKGEYLIQVSPALSDQRTAKLIIQ